MAAPVDHTEVRVDPLADQAVHTEAVPDIVRRPRRRHHTEVRITDRLCHMEAVLLQLLE